ncbi:Cytoplasmic thioredoxin isoenzyme 2 [Stylosanthes scabra]|uniref:Cytoplasmic thioredoxin isoenzyme 2 n=1 Tax=Stylosanthes scabra TaxID=79078 RepID=A0ABU6T8S5_9FABA|nr:Cytoplasmic thioredoxin isoenzyme 2 [Stylosanthes scabra]
MGGVLSAVLGGDAAAAAADGDSAEGSQVKSFHSSPRFQLHFNEIKDSSKLVVIDFSASWCGPCKFIEPHIHAMAENYTDVEFIKLDVDQLPDVAKDFQVQAMPTFVLVKQGKEIDRVVGAKKDELEKKVKQYRA